jgi:MFS family permease
VSETAAADQRVYSRLWANRPYRVFWLANLLSNLGTSTFVMAMTWLTVSRYGAHGIALLTLGYGIPQFLLEVFGGAATDRVAHRQLFLRTESAFLGVALVLWLASTRGVVPLWLLVGVNACNGVISAFDTPARTTLITEMVRSDDLVNAQQFYSVAANLTNVFGPALGGILLSLGNTDQAHEEFAFLFNVLSFLPLLACIPLLPASQRLSSATDQAPQQQRLSMLVAIGEGVRYVSSHRHLRRLMLLLAAVMVLGMPFQTLLPIFVHDHLSQHGGHQFYAALLSAVGFGGLVGSLLGMSAGQGRRLGLILAAAAVGLGLAILLLVGSTVIHWASLAAFLAGSCSVFSINLNNALTMGLTPLALQGRVSAMASMGKGLQSFAAAGASELIHLLGGAVQPMSAYQLVQSALAMALIAAVVWIWIPLSRIEGVSQPAEGSTS